MLVRTTRGDYTDLIYRGHIVVADAKGQILYYHGNPDQLVFPRSATKAIQALAALETGALEYYGIIDKELALICGSHGGTKEQTALVETILGKAGLTKDQLQCGSHLPLDKKERREMLRQGLSPSPLHNNCSAKHAAMLLSSSYLNEDLNSYLDFNHPHQLRILQLMEDFTDIKKEDIGLALDGCGVPVHGGPIKNWARAFARLVDTDNFSSTRQAQIKRIRGAIRSNPEMLASEGRMDTDLILATNGLIPKIGANGFYSLALEEEKLGIAIKIESGHEEVLIPVVVHVLDQLGIEVDKAKLKNHLSTEIYNHQKKVVGQTIVDFKLREFK